MEIFRITVVAILALAVGFGLGFLIRNYAIQSKIKKQQQEAKEQIHQAENKASEIVLAARDEALKIRNEAEQHRGPGRSL